MRRLKNLYRKPLLTIWGLSLGLVACGGTTAAPTPIPPAAAARATQPPPTAATTLGNARPTATTGQASREQPPITQTPLEAPSRQTPAEAPTEAPPAAPESTIVTAPPKLNLNEVSSDALLNTIPNFGNRMVREFFEYRPYISIQQFRREIGKYVSPEQVAEYEQYVYVPIDVNASDAETLKQLPGVDDVIAADLIAGRPYASNAAFLEALARHLPTLTGAEGYLVTP